MPAAVEVYQDQASFASRRFPAWHALGTVFQEDVTTQEMLRLAHLDNWNVRLEDIILPARSKVNYYATVRDNPYEAGEKDVLGVVKERYRPYQNESLFDFGDAILDGGRWETAGSIKDGRVVFGSLAIDHDVVIDPNGVSDKINSYLLVSTSHDGSLSIQASVTPVRVVCANTLSVALAGAKQSYKFRHTATAEGRIMAAREALGVAHKFMDALEVEAKALYQTAIDTQKFFDIVQAAYPKPEQDVKGSETKWQSKVDNLFSIYESDTVTGAGIGGTAWGAYNTLTERLDWFRNPRKGDASGAYIAASGFDAATTVEKARLLSVVKEVVGVA